MAGTVPVAGHNAIYAIEVDPTEEQGTFTTLPEVTSSVSYDSNREEAEITAHGSGVDSYVLSPVLKRPDLTIEGTYKYANAVHLALHNHYHNKLPFGLVMIGPDGSLPSADTAIHSGECKSWKQDGPNRTGEYKFTAVFRPSGPFIKNGVEYS